MSPTGLAQAAEHIAITRKTLLNLPDEVPPVATTPTAVVPEGPAYQQILAVFAEADAPLRARNVCEAMDLPLNINNIRTKPKRLTRHATEIEPGSSPPLSPCRPASPPPPRSLPAKG